MRIGSVRIGVARIAIAAAMLATGILNCGVLVERNRVLTGVLDEHLAPESPTARVALAPIAVPVGLSSMARDAVLLNPLSLMPEAASDTADLISEVPWTGIGEIIVFPMRVITVPVLFTAIVLAHTFLPLD
mgnify:CR=1 FL=1